MDTNLKLIMAVLALVIGAGCASEKGGGGTQAAVPTPVVACTDPSCTQIASPTPVPGSGGYYSGSSAALALTSQAELAKMFFNSNPNNPQNVQININLSRPSDAVIISYSDAGQTHEAAYGTTHPYSGVSDASFNGWVNQSGKQVWKGFFQDTYGAIVLIVDKFITQGDGQSGNILGGSVWFQNFNRYYPNFGTQGPTKMCWQISMGPYDCRTFLVGDVVSVTSSYYPNNHGPDANMNYEKLGDFNGIAKDASGF
jgi:hypothetical protein